MSDTWSRPVYFGNPHQAVETDLGLGHGLYLSDRGLAPGSMQVTLERDWSVLNLVDGTLSRAWRDFENKVSPLEGRSHRAIMSIDRQSYSRMVKLFASMNGIQVDKYDVIIGPHYKTGGTLICVRNLLVQNHIRSQAADITRQALGLNPMNSPGRQLRRDQVAGATMLLDYWFTGIVKHWQNGRASAEGEKIYGQVKAAQAKDPTVGALIRFAWLTTRLNDSSGFVNKSAVISAQEVFQYADFFFDTSKDRALKRMHAEKGHVEMRASGGRQGVYRDDWRNEIVWIQPPQVRVSPIGWWKVRIGSSTIWHYQFLESAVVTWVDPGNGESGKGRWTVDGDVMRISWAPSDSVEEWEFPLRLKDQGGFMRWKGTRYDFTATFGEAPPTTQTAPTGRWRVKCLHWVWIYDFDPMGGVRWTDPIANLSGTGKWSMAAGKMTIKWASSDPTSIDTWKLPLIAAGTSGTNTSQSKSNDLTAVKIS